MKRGPISMVIVGSIVLGAFAFVMLNPRSLGGIVPDAVIGALEGGQTLATHAGQPAGDAPADFLSDGSEGIAARGPIAALAGNKPAFISDVITTYRTQVGSEVPAEVTTIRPITGCRLTPPGAGAKVGHVTAGDSKLDLTLSTYNDTHLAAAVQVFVDSYRSGTPALAADMKGPAYQAYDVAVTEVGAPVYLVLENADGNRIWNIHLAPGARVERVVLLGGDHAGVANLDPVVPVEVLPGAALAACGIQPAYSLNAGHHLNQSIKTDALLKVEAETKLAVIEAAVASYGIWFRDSFGILAEDSRAGFEEGTISVVGPVPSETDQKAVYMPIQGAQIRTTEDTYFEIRGQSRPGEDFSGMVEAIARSFAFGDLKNLRQGVEF